MAMNQLSSIQKEIIERSYLENEGEFDYISCGEMGLSDRTFRRIKAEAICILAVAMDLVQLKISNNINKYYYNI
ncbi:hypothetical protein [Paenibacillus sp. Y412MC10]|uniref:hypothetical protein n=1 Tax=Geobacillus sp. (strain Y412MC10) TaxID=481743 RepID=UPI0021B2DEDA|nr:hypothetical protein [Paenibacillus sp. Y412MC10]